MAKFSSFIASEFDGSANHLVFGKSCEMLCGFSKGKTDKLVLVVPSFVLLHLLGPHCPNTGNWKVMLILFLWLSRLRKTLKGVWICLQMPYWSFRLWIIMHLIMWWNRLDQCTLYESCQIMSKQICTGVYSTIPGLVWWKFWSPCACCRSSGH